MQMRTRGEVMILMIREKAREWRTTVTEMAAWSPVNKQHLIMISQATEVIMLEER